MIRALLAASLLALTTPLAAQVAPRAIDTWGRPLAFDAQAGSFVDAAPAAAAGGPALIYPNGADNGSYLPGVLNEIYMDWGRLTGFGENGITQALICYATTNTSPTVDITFRLHSGFEDKRLPGAGVAIDLTVPGSPTGDALATQIAVFFDPPLFLPDGPIRYSIQGHDSLTGPVLADRNEDLEINNILQFFYSDGGEQPDFDFGSNGDPASIFLELTGVAHAPDLTDALEAPLTGKHLFHGQLDDPADTDVFHFDALPGEFLGVAVLRARGSDLLPAIAVHDAVSGALLAESAPGGGKAGIKRVEVPDGGTVSATVSAVAGSGGYLLRFVSRVGRDSVKPAVAAKGAVAGAPLTSFWGRAGSQLTAVIFPTVKTTDVPPPPVLDGPLGPLDLGDTLFAKKNRYVVRRFTLPADGPYRLLSGAVPEGEAGGFTDVVVGAKVVVRPPRLPLTRADELDATLSGHWVQDDFMTELDLFTVHLDADRRRGDSRIVDMQKHPNGSPPAQTVTYELADWGAEPLTPGPGGQRALSYRVQSVTAVPATPTAPPSEVLRIYEHPNGDPDVIHFIDGGSELDEVWRRDVLNGPALPSATVVGVASSADPGAPTLNALRIAYDPGVDHYRVHKGSLATSIMPPRPIALHTALPFGDEGDTVTLFVDQTSADGLPANYWIVAVDAEGRRSRAVQVF